MKKTFKIELEGRMIDLDQMLADNQQTHAQASELAEMTDVWSMACPLLVSCCTIQNAGGNSVQNVDNSIYMQDYLKKFTWILQKDFKMLYIKKIRVPKGWVVAFAKHFTDYASLHVDGTPHFQVF